MKKLIFIKNNIQVIERLQNISSTPDTVARHCVLGKDT